MSTANATVAAIDVGSNAMRLAIGRVQRDGRVRGLAAYRAPVRLGKDVFQQGKISPQTAELAVEALLEFKKQLKRHNVNLVRAVATSAVRDAQNGVSFREYLGVKTGLHVCVISGVEEARLIHEAMVDGFDLERKRMLLLDIGGGSVELMASRGGKFFGAMSLKLGTVRLLGKSPERVRSEIKKAERELGAFIRQHFGSKTVDVFAGTGGNIEALGRLRTKVLHANSERVLGTGELDVLIAALKSLSVRDRIKKLKLRDDRADVIVPAALVLRSVMGLARVDRAFIPGIGLKDGVLSDLARELTGRDSDLLCQCFSEFHT